MKNCKKSMNTSAKRILRAEGCFLANNRMTSGVWKAWLIAAWIAYWLG
jgi:hypothetical protein